MALVQGLVILLDWTQPRRTRGLILLRPALVAVCHHA